MGISRANSAPAALCEPADGTKDLPNRLAAEHAQGESAHQGAGREIAGLEPFSEAEQVLLSLAKVVELKDSVTSGHCERLAITAVALGVAMELDFSSLLALYLGGYLHDIGKIYIPDSVLFNPGKLNEEEWKVMHTHPARGEEICRPLLSVSCVLPLIRHHHERWDGTGYPDRLSGCAIPLLARVLQVADIYDALTSARPYKPAFSTAGALEILEEETARGWRDPEVTGLFIGMHQRMLSKIADYRVGANDERVSMQDTLRNLQEFLTH